MIMKYINMAFEDHDLKLGNKIKSNPDYEKAQDKYNALIDALDKTTMIAIDDATCLMETISRDVSYDEGFMEGIRFILGCSANGKEGGIQEWVIQK